MRIKVVLVVLVLGLGSVVATALAGGGEPAPTATRELDGLPANAVPAADQVEATEPWVRPMPMAGRNTGAYVRLENPGPEADALVVVETEAAEVAELHEMAIVNEMMRMRQVERIDLAAGETVVLEPGGLHIMLIRLTRPIEEGDTIEITLRFASGAEQTLEFVARAPQAGHQGGNGAE